MILIISIEFLKDFFLVIRIPLIIGFSMNEDDETMVLSETFLVLAFLIVTYYILFVEEK